MVTWFGLAALVSVCAIHLFVDVRLWGTRATPGVALMGGYTLIAGIYAVVSLFYRVKVIGPFVYVLLVAFGLFSILVSVVTCYMVSWRKHMLNLTTTMANAKLRPALIVTILIYIALALPKVLGSGGLWSGESNEGMATGLVGHFHVILSFMVVWYACGTCDRGFIKGLLYVTAVFALTFYPVKGWILIPAFAITFAEVQKEDKKGATLRPLIVMGITGVLLFFGFYLSRQMTAGDVSIDLLAAQFKPVFEHFLIYLIAGFFGLDAVVDGLKLPGGLEVIFAPLINLYSVFSGDAYVNIISGNFNQGFYDMEASGNVYSMLGSLVGYAGFYMGIIIALFFLGGTYLVFGLSLRLRSSALWAASLYLTAIFAFGWFEFYFWHLRPYEILLFALLGLFFEQQGRRSFGVVKSSNEIL
jgi:hypothetical protein